MPLQTSSCSLLCGSARFGSVSVPLLNCVQITPQTRQSTEYRVQSTEYQEGTHPVPSPYLTFCLNLNSNPSPQQAVGTAGLPPWPSRAHPSYHILLPLPHQAWGVCYMDSR